MSRSIFILIIVLVGVVAHLAAEPGTVDSPGATGMATNIDPTQLRATDAQFIANLDITTTVGLFQRRLGLLQYGQDSIEIRAATYLFDAPTQNKTVVAVRPADSIFYGNYDNDDDTISQTYWNLSRDTLSFFGYAAAFKTPPQNEVTGWPLNAHPTNQKFVTTESFAHYVDGWSPPATIPAVDLGTKVLTQYRCVDTVAFAPYVTPLSLEPPGAFRVFPINGRGGLTGTFQYASSFYGKEDAEAWDSLSPMGPASMEVSVSSGCIALTCFPQFPVPIADTLDTVAVRIYRKDLDDAVPAWYILDSIRYVPNAQVWYIDSTGNPTTIYSDTLNYGPGLDSLPTPGAPRVYESYASAVDSTLAWKGSGVQTYYFRLSWYDRITGAESPLGPMAWHQVDTAADGAPKPALLTLPYYYDWGRHAKHMRVYMNVNHPNIAGTGDTLLWYLWCEVDMDSLNTAFYDTDLDINQIFVGIVHDTTLARGDPQRPEFADGSPYTWYYHTAAPLKKTSFPVDEGGSAITRPPHIENIAAPFSTIAYANDRMWGAGDINRPSRIYYSEYDDIHNWPGFNYFDVSPGDGDAVVALVTVPVNGTEAVLAFKRNKTFLISGYDPEHDLTVFTLEDGVGAMAQSLVVEHRGIVYFLDRNLRAYRIVNGARPEYISRSVRDEMLHVCMDSVVVIRGKDWQQSGSASIPYADIDVRAMAFGDDVLFVNQKLFDGRAMTYNTISHTWSVNKFALTSPPRGTFRYDTTNSITLDGETEELMYSDDTTAARIYGFLRKADTIYTDIDSSIIGQYVSPLWGGEGYDWSIPYIDFEVTGELSGSIYIVNAQRDTLATASLATATTTDGRVYRVGLPRHASGYVGFEFVAGVSVSTNFLVHGYRAHLRKMGGSRAK